MSEDGWVALEDASNVFERPSWAIRVLVEQGKLERKTENGHVFVRQPRPSGGTSSGGIPQDTSSREISRDTSSGEISQDTSSAEIPQEEIASARAVEDLAHELAPLLAASDSHERAATAIAIERLEPVSAAPIADLRMQALLCEVAANLADLAHAARARDALLARTAQALRAVEVATARAVEPRPEARPEPRRISLATTLVLAALALVAVVAARVDREGATAERAEAELTKKQWAARSARLDVLASDERRRADDLERRERALAIAASAPATSASIAIAPTSSESSTLPAGFPR